MKRINIPTKLDTWFLRKNATKTSLTSQSTPDQIYNVLSASFNKTTDESAESTPPNTMQAGTRLMWIWNWDEPHGDDISVGLVTGRKHLTGTIPLAEAEFYLNYNTVFGTCPLHTVFCEYQDERLWLARGGWVTSMGEVYLADTLNYIITGKRIVDQQEWYTIFKDKALGTIDQSDLDIKAINFTKLKALTRAQLFTLWISRPGGIRDLIITHQTLFRSIWTW